MVAINDNLAERNAPGNLRRGIVRFHPWQERFFRDASRVIIAIWHRQAGKDFVAAAKAVDDAFRTHRDWYIVSLTQRQADATFDKALKIAECFKRALKKKGEIAVSEAAFEEYDSEIDHWFERKARTLKLPGGGSVTALPGRNPDTLAGLTGNVIFTEFGLLPKGGYDHWRVIFPLSTRGFQVLVISTPRGKNSKLYELASNTELYSVHFQTILDSVREGLVLYDNRGEPTDIETFRAIYDDEAGWRREYLCEWTGDLEALVKWASIEACSDPAWPVEVCRVEGEAGWRSGFFKTHRDHAKARRFEIGWDVARTSNLSPVWVQGDGEFGGRRPLLYLALLHNATFALQREIVREAIDAFPGSVGIGDATGLGMDSNETLSTLYAGQWKGLQFTEGVKRDLASGLFTAFQDRLPLLPDSRGPLKFIHTDIYAIQCDRSSGKLAIEYGVNPLLEESHCDIGISGELATEAARMKRAEASVWTA